MLHLNLPLARLIHFTFLSCRGCAQDVLQILRVYLVNHEA